MTWTTLRLAILLSALVPALSLVQTAPATAQARPPVRDRAAADRLRAQGNRPGNPAGPTEVETRVLALRDSDTLVVINALGRVSVTGGGSELRVEITRRLRAPRGGQARQGPAPELEVIEQDGRVELRTVGTRDGPVAAMDLVIVAPAGASTEIRTVGGSIDVRGMTGRLGIETVGGRVTTVGTPGLESVRSVSGDVDVADARTSGHLRVGTVGGDIFLRDLESQGLDVTTIGGSLRAVNLRTGRADVRTVSGAIAIDGRLSPGGRYVFVSHSGDVRLEVEGDTGFDMDATSFSGAILANGAAVGEPAGPRGRRGGAGRQVRTRVGDGSAFVRVQSFSGEISVGRR
ncbi:MAG: DUF4097 domain-containing protein [Vicinamibacterales bacterium]